MAKGSSTNRTTGATGKPMNFTQDEANNIDIIEFRRKVAAFVLLKQGRTTSSIACQLKMRERDLIEWIEADCPLRGAVT